jgi:hypothetical protein
VLDRDDLKKKVRDLLHPKCKAFLALGRDNPLRFQMAIAYLERNEPPLSGRKDEGAVHASRLGRPLQTAAQTAGRAHDRECNGDSTIIGANIVLGPSAC